LQAILHFLALSNTITGSKSKDVLSNFLCAQYLDFCGVQKGRDWHMSTGSIDTQENPAPFTLGD